MNKTACFFSQLFFFFKSFHDSGEKNSKIVKHITGNFAYVFLIQWESSEEQENQNTFKTEQNPTELPNNQCEIHRLKR